MEAGGRSKTKHHQKKFDKFISSDLFHFAPLNGQCCVNAILLEKSLFSIMVFRNATTGIPLQLDCASETGIIFNIFS